VQTAAYFHPIMTMIIMFGVTLSLGKLAKMRLEDQHFSSIKFTALPLPMTIFPLPLFVNQTLLPQPDLS